jgi:3-deoxy-D-manno-octulosonic-acid transferase
VSLDAAYLIYNVLAGAAAPVVVGAAMVRRRLSGRWRQRFGLELPEPLGTGRRIWLHAVSVGEVEVAAALAAALKERRPDLTLFMSVTTETGRKTAEERLDIPVYTFPIDVYGSPGRALDRLKPDMVIILETELWPNFLRAASQRDVRVMLANGRISVRSFNGYHRARFLIKKVLAYFDRLAMIGPDDRDRIVQLGADADRVYVTGNAKYDLLLGRADMAKVAKLKAVLGVTGEPVIVAGSTREGEEEQVLDAVESLWPEQPNLRLIVAPRHLGRVGGIVDMVRERGHEVDVISRLAANGSPRVVIVDQMGLLLHLYGVASAAYVGGSLVPLGGQNPLEPAVYGKPVLYGPDMNDFLDAKAMLESAGAGVTVTDSEDLANKLAMVLRDPAKADQMGRAGQEALRAHQGVSGRLADMALDLLGMDKDALS